MADDKLYIVYQYQYPDSFREVDEQEQPVFPENLEAAEQAYTRRLEEMIHEKYPHAILTIERAEDESIKVYFSSEAVREEVWHMGEALFYADNSVWWDAGTIPN